MGGKKERIFSVKKKSGLLELAVARAEKRTGMGEKGGFGGSFPCGGGVLARAAMGGGVLGGGGGGTRNNFTPGQGSPVLSLSRG